MKALLREIGALVGIAATVGLVYNAFNPNGIPLLRHERTLPVVDDTTLQRELEQWAVAKTPTPLQSDRDRAQAAPPPQPRETASTAPRVDAQARSPAEREPVIRAVRYEQVLQLLQHPELLLIDARRPEDYAAGHIPGARNIFAYDFAAHIPELITLPRTKPILIYCDGGQCELSHMVAEQLQALGFQRLYVYEGGWDEWRRRHGEQQP